MAKVEDSLEGILGGNGKYFAVAIFEVKDGLGILGGRLERSMEKRLHSNSFEHKGWLRNHLIPTK